MKMTRNHQFVSKMLNGLPNPLQMLQTQNKHDDSEESSGDSRTKAVFGEEALKTMQKASFFVFGCTGVGAETAKDIFLTGCSVTVSDPEPVSNMDFCSNPFFVAADLGKPRDVVLAKALKELNPQKQALQATVTDLKQLDHYQTVIYTRSTRFTARQVSNYCHQHKIPFILAETHGLFGRIFCDFGEEFWVHDTDGEKVDDITASEMFINNENGKLRMFVGTKDTMPYEDNDLVDIRDLKFLIKKNEAVEEQIQEEMNKMFNIRRYRVKLVNKKMIEILFGESDDKIYQRLSELERTGHVITHLRGGYLRKIKEPKAFAFKPLEEASICPTFAQDMIDFNKLDSREVLNEVYRFVDSKANYLEAFTKPWNTQDFEKFYAELQAATNADVVKTEMGKRVAQIFVGQHMGQFSPISSITGGWAAQEALKAVSGKYSPIQQFAYFDATEILKEIPTEAECKLTGSRYDGQIAIWGAKLQAQVQNQAIFVVGSGALGCEIIKFLALSGACSKKETDLTDLDSIEKSNLSRQFLFRDEDITKMKSVVAASRALKMNPDSKINPLTVRIGNKNPMTPEFWQNKNIIINALDNIPTRQFVDQKCVQYEKPLLESGTTGPKANAQVIVPRVTQIYSATQDLATPEEPLCTIHNFPNTIAHCITYALNEFTGLFQCAASDINRWFEVKDEKDLLQFANTMNENPTMLKTRFCCLLQLLQNPIRNERDCYRFAACQFKRFFSKMISQLLELNPLDKLNSDGSAFWSSAKRPPKVLKFDMNDPAHKAFAQFGSKLIGNVFGVQFKFDLQVAEQVFKEIDQLDVFTTTDCEKLVDTYYEHQTKLYEANIKFKPANKVEEVIFEKDNRKNGHVSFLAAFSNLRAQNYDIPNVDEQEIRRIAGNIIPAMITTTAVIVGHVGIEFVKLAFGFKAIEDFKQVFMNVAVPMSTLSENEACSKQKTIHGKEFTVWDYLDMRGNPTIQDIIQKAKDEWNLTLSALCNGDGKSIYNEAMERNSSNEEKQQKVRDILKEMGESYAGEIVLVTMPDEESEMPLLRIRE